MRILLKNRSLLKISGNDAEEFLQNQFTNDIKKLDSKNVQFNAYCQHQGKVIAFFWVVRMDEDFLLSFPDDLLAKVKANPENLDMRLTAAKALAGSGRNEEAIEHLLYSIAKNRSYNNEAARLFLLTIFEAEGATSEISINGRRALSSILFA